MSAPQDAAPAPRGTKAWGKRGHRPQLPPGFARRQGEITRLAFLLLGRETAIAFLNTAHAKLGGRPLDLATASDHGRNNVESEIGRLAFAAQRDAQMLMQPIVGVGPDGPGDRSRSNRAAAHGCLSDLGEPGDSRGRNDHSPEGAGAEDDRGSA